MGSLKRYTVLTVERLRKASLPPSASITRHDQQKTGHPCNSETSGLVGGHLEVPG